MSSSGGSENILRAAKEALKRGCKLVTFSGFSPENPLRQLGHFNVYVASSEYGYVEVGHTALAHFITDCAMLRGQR